MEVVCVTKGVNDLTYGKSYEVIFKENKFYMKLYYITNDQNVAAWYNQSQVILKSDRRIRILNKLLDINPYEHL